MSSWLCKKAEGAIPPLVVEAVEDRKDDAVDAGDVDETDHGPGAPPHLHEAALDDVGGAQRGERDSGSFAIDGDPARQGGRDLRVRLQNFLRLVGVADLVEVCTKDAADAYGWRTVI